MAVRTRNFICPKIVLGLLKGRSGSGNPRVFPLKSTFTSLMLFRYNLLMKQHYEVGCMQKLAATSVMKEQQRREEFDSFVDDALAKS